MIEKGSPAYLRLLTKKLIEEGLIANCATCAKFNAETEMCSAAVASPPPSIAANGCEAWNDLPF